MIAGSADRDKSLLASRLRKIRPCGYTPGRTPCRDLPLLEYNAAEPPNGHSARPFKQLDNRCDPLSCQ